METFITYLKSIHPLSQGMIDYLRKNLKERTVAKKEFILKAGRTANHISFIQSGLIRCFYMEGEAQISGWFMKEGDVFVSVSSFFNQKPSGESIHALEDSVLYDMSYEALQLMYHTYPESNFVGRILTEKYYQLCYERCVSLQSQNATERYEYLRTHYPDLIKRVPSKYIASYLGISEVMLSKIRNKK